MGKNSNYNRKLREMEESEDEVFTRKGKINLIRRSKELRRTQERQKARTNKIIERG